jgi:hypothetical protein
MHRSCCSSSCCETINCVKSHVRSQRSAQRNAQHAADYLEGCFTQQHKYKVQQVRSGTLCVQQTSRLWPKGSGWNTHAEGLLVQQQLLLYVSCDCGQHATPQHC